MKFFEDKLAACGPFMLEAVACLIRRILMMGCIVAALSGYKANIRLCVWLSIFYIGLAVFEFMLSVVRHSSHLDKQEALKHEIMKEVSDHYAPKL